MKAKPTAHNAFPDPQFLGFSEQLFSAAGDPVIILDAQFRIQYVNHLAEQFLKLSSHALHARFFAEFIVPEEEEKFRDCLTKIKQKALSLRLQMTLQNGAGERTVNELSLSPISKGGRMLGACAVLRDIQEEKQIEELVHESQKMEALQNFVSGATQELKNPLFAVLKRVESMETRYRDRSFEYISFQEFKGIIQFLETIRKQIKHCYDTTLKLTNLSKKRLKFESSHCEVNGLIREWARLKEPYFGATNVTCRLRLKEKLPYAGIGELELNQIISSVVDNAVQAMPAGGVVTISTDHNPGANRIQVDVRDEGVGIAPEDLPHIFEPFFTTKQRGVERSTGLGLSIVYSLVKASHGDVRVTSSLRKGTTVHLIFPVASATETQHKKAKHK